MACAEVHQGGCDGDGLAAGAVVMVVGGGGFCVSEGEAGVGKSYGRARRGEARQGSGQSCRVRGPWQRLNEPPAASTSSSRRLVVVAAAERLGIRQ